MLHNKCQSPGGGGGGAAPSQIFNSRSEALLKWCVLDREESRLVKMKWKVTLLLFPAHCHWVRGGDGAENHAQCKYAIVPCLCPHHPRRVVVVLSVTCPSIHHPCHCNPTVSPSFLSLAFVFFICLKLYRRHLCLWLMFRVGGLCLHRQNASVV